MTDKNNPDQLWLMLGEIRSDLKFLVAERSATNRRLDDMENDLAVYRKEQETRLARLEAFKVRIGVLTGGLGVLVPTALAVISKKLGWV